MTTYTVRLLCREGSGERRVDYVVHTERGALAAVETATYQHHKEGFRLSDVTRVYAYVNPSAVSP